MAMDVDTWLRSSEEFLAGARAFIWTSKNTAFLRGIRGEILALRQILRTYKDDLKDLDARLEYRGSSRKDCDIVLTVRGREIQIDCKERSQGDHWVRMHARDYAVVETDPATGIQRIKPREDARDGFFYVFVDSTRFHETGEAAFYVLSDSEAMISLSEVYRKQREVHGNVRRPRNPDSDDFWGWPKDIEVYADDKLLRFMQLSGPTRSGSSPSAGGLT